MGTVSIYMGTVYHNNNYKYISIYRITWEHKPSRDEPQVQLSSTTYDKNQAFIGGNFGLKNENSQSRKLT